MSPIKQILPALLATLLCYGCAQESRASEPRPGDANIIRFYLPGHFRDAVARSIKDDKPVLLKGVGQIVDIVVPEDFNRGQC